MLEGSDQGLEANALAPNQQVVSVAKPHVGDDDPRRLAGSHADQESIRPRRIGNLGGHSGKLPASRRFEPLRALCSFVLVLTVGGYVPRGWVSLMTMFKKEALIILIDASDGLAAS